MKIKYFIYLFILINTCVFAQFKPHKHNPKIEKARTEFIKNEMALENDVAKQFWPLYKQHHTQIRQMFKELRKLHKNINIDDLSEQEANSLLNKITTREEKIEAEKVVFKNEMKKLLSSKQILKLKISEKSFRRNLLKKMKHKQKNN